MGKLYERVNWEDKPSTKTPTSAANFNKMDKGIDDLDNKLVEQETKTESLASQVEQIASDQIPEEYLKASVDAYIDEKGAGLATNEDLVAIDTKIDEVNNQLSSEIVEVENGLTKYSNKVTTLHVSRNKFNYAECVKNSALTDMGKVVTVTDGRGTTGKMYVSPNETLYFSSWYGQSQLTLDSICAYSEDNIMIEIKTNCDSYVVPQNASYVIACVKYQSVFENNNSDGGFMVEVGEWSKSYEAFFEPYYTINQNVYDKTVVEREDTVTMIMGERYITRLSTDYSPVMVRQIPNNVYILGNSITAGFYSDNDNSNGLMHGMASSTKDTDYVALVTEYLKSLNPNVNVVRRYAYSGWYLEETICNQHGGSITASFNDMVKPYLPETLDLVIIWLGDNVNDAVGQSRYRECMEELINCFKSERPMCRVLCCGLWYNATALYSELETACKNASAEIVDMRAYHTDENTIQYGDVVTDGSGNQITISESTDAKSHPNDLGMKAFADEIIKVLNIEF